MTIIELSHFRKNELELLSILSSHEENVPAGAGWARTPAPPGPWPPGGQGHSPGTAGGWWHCASPLTTLPSGAGEDAPLRVGQWRPGQRPAADLAAGAQHRLAAGAAGRHGHRPPQGD